MTTILTPSAFDRADTIATLGDTSTSITCSQHVAKISYPENGRIGADTFEEAADMVKDGRAKLLLVPGAYPDIGQFLMDEDLRLLKAFEKPIPALVYGNTVNDPAAAVETIYHHAAVKSLLTKLPVQAGTNFIAVKSNEVAYEAMVRHGERAGCVSNKIVFEYYDRPSLMTLRTEREMSWNVFALRSARRVKGGRA